MKTILLYILPLLLLLSSCSLSKDVNNGRFIQKRKYNKGFHIGGKAGRQIVTSQKKSDTKVITPISPSTISVEKKEKISESIEAIEIVENLNNSTELKEVQKGNYASISTSKSMMIEEVKAIQPLKNKTKISDEGWVQNRAKPAINSGLDVLIYLAITLFALPMIGGIIYLALTGCSKGDVLVNLLLVALGSASAFFGMVIAFSGLVWGIAFIILAMALLLAALIQGIHAISNKHSSKSREDKEFYIVD